MSTPFAPSSVSPIGNLPKNRLAPADTATALPAFTRPRVERAASDRMVGNAGAQAPQSFLGRNSGERALLESACQGMYTRLTEGPMHNVAFMHEGQEGNARYNPRTEPVISVRVGATPGALTISSLTDIAYRGTPLARLQGPELQAATRLANSVTGSAGSASRI